MKYDRVLFLLGSTVPYKAATSVETTIYSTSKAKLTSLNREERDASRSSVESFIVSSFS